MKKFILALVAVLLLAILGILGINIFKGSGPRERIKAESGGKLIVEELSYYNHGDKMFGKLYKPANEDGDFPDSLGSRPVVMFIHEPLKTAYAESMLKSLTSQGLIGYVADCPAKSKGIDFLVKKIGKEKFTSEGMIFIIADAFSAEATVESVSRIGSKIAGLVLIEPALQNKAAIIAQKHESEILTITSDKKSSAVEQIVDYMELRGAFK